jgi:hypothetical protein
MKNALLFFALLMASCPSMAALGEHETSVLKDADSAAVVRKSVKNWGSYSVHVLQQDGMNIKEYLSSSGVVFAVSWKGPRHVDFPQFFGRYFTPYKKALKFHPAKRSRRSHRISGNNVVVQTGGHMGAVYGFAYVPSLVPSGLSPSELKP